MPILTKGSPLFTSPSANLSPEQDALRWRALVERIQRLETQLAQTVRYGPQPTHGGQIIFGETIQGSNFSVSDGTRVRVEMGNLLANGISPAQYGLRVNDASGAPIFDSLGLIAVMTQLASGFASGTFSVTSGTPTLITGATITFSLTRAISVLVAYGASMSVPATNDGGTDTVDLFIDGVNKSAAGNGPALELQFAVTTGGATTGSGVYTQSLSSGSHTVELRAARNGTNTPTVLQAGVAAYNMGK